MAGSTVAEETFEVLRRFGVDRAFGNPGSTEMHMFVDWPDDLDYVLALQEASVVAMADGYAQRSGRPGFVNLHTAAGLGNAMGAVVSAARNNTPLLIVVVSPPATGAAPLGLDYTGDATFCVAWSFLGMPAVTIPSGRAANGLPLGFQLIGERGADLRVLQRAAWAAATLPAFR